MMTTLRALVIAFSMYSQIPMPQFTWQDKEMKYAFCFFPWVGAAIGGITMFWWWFCGKFSVGNVAFAMNWHSHSTCCYRRISCWMVYGYDGCVPFLPAEREKT